MRFSWQLTAVDAQVWALIKPVEPAPPLFNRQVVGCVVCGRQQVTTAYSQTQSTHAALAYVKVKVCQEHLLSYALQPPPNAYVVTSAPQGYQSPLISMRPAKCTEPGCTRYAVAASSVKGLGVLLCKAHRQSSKLW